jgi:MFS family permease
MIGISSGLTMVTVPLYLSDIAPAKYRTKFGVLHQIWIGLGMISAQSLSIPFSKPWIWRYSLLVGVGLAGILLLGSFAMGETNSAVKARDEGAEEEGHEETPLIAKCEFFIWTLYGLVD